MVSIVWLDTANLNCSLRVNLTDSFEAKTNSPNRSEEDIEAFGSV